MALHSIELCAGVGMLGEGFRAACEFHGIEHRTVLYVEREALQPRSLSASWKREPLIRRLSGLTFEPSTAQRGADAWISLLRASRARISQSLVVGPALTARAAGCSSMSSTLPTLAVREASFWRTSAASLLPPPPLWTKPKANSKNARPPASWENWPTAGGMRSGSLFQRPMWAPVMAEPGGSALHGEWLTPNVPSGGRSVSAELVASKGTTLDGDKKTVGLESQTKHWMTPSVSNSQGNEYTRDRGQEGQERLTLTGQASQWPSPNVQDAEAAGGQGAIERGTRGETLHTATSQWPTPESRDWRSESGTPEFVANRLSQARGQSLSFTAVHSASSHPAPPTLDGLESLPSSQASRRRLNPAFACWLMGWPWWYTNPGLTSCAKSAMESWRHRLGLHLQSYCEGRG